MPDLDGIRRIQARHAFLQLMRVPAGFLPGADRAPGIGRLVELHHGAALAGRRGGLLARALHRGEAALASRLAQGRKATAANTVAAVARPELLHPGVRRYLAEIAFPPRGDLGIWGQVLHSDISAAGCLGHGQKNVGM